MSITYVGNCNLRTVGTQFTRDLWGLDVMVRTYQVRSDKAKQTLDQFGSRKVADPDYPSLTLQNVSFSQQQSPITTITATYRGLLKEQEPEVQVAFSIQDETVELVNVTTLGTISIDYRAPQTVYTYSAKTAPTTFKYKGKTHKFRENFQITNHRGFAGGTLIKVDNGIIKLVIVGGVIQFQINGQTIGLAAAEGNLKKFFNTIPYAVENVAALTFDQVGSVYAVTETISQRVVRPDLTNFVTS